MLDNLEKNYIFWKRWQNMENKNKNTFEGKSEEEKQSGLHLVSHLRKQLSW